MAPVTKARSLAPRDRPGGIARVHLRGRGRGTTLGDSARARASSERSSTSTTDILKKVPLWVGTVSTEGRGRGVDAATSSTRGSSLDFRIGTRVQQERHGEDSLTRHRPSTRFGPHPTACYSFFPPPRALKFGISSILLNRIVSGVAAVSDAGSSQSRADVIGIVLSASCVLTGLQWSSIKARTYPKVDQGGVVVSFVDESVGLEALVVFQKEGALVGYF